MDFDFNLYFNLEGIVESWVVKKLIKDGIVIGLEVYDVQGEFIVYFFGKCKFGILELESWWEIIKNLNLVFV